MILQTLDIKNNCKGIYINNEFILEPSDSQLKEHKLAWKHSPMLDDEGYKYLYPSLREKELSIFSPDPENFKACAQKLQAHRKAIITAKVNLSDECFFDLLPKHCLSEWFHLRAQALESVHRKVKEAEDYDILHKAHVLTENIAHQDISFDGKNGKVLYNIFGSATGRLTTVKGSVPVLTLKKDQRSLLTPQNDAFVELDLNAAEIRMLLALTDQAQPEGDIHEWVAENIFSGEFTREEVKIKIFSWLYNFSAPKSRLDEIFSRQIFRDFYFQEKETLSTPYGRRLKVEERKAQNYLLQSTTSDQVIENAYKIQKMLKGKRSNIAFTLHDSIILDMSREDGIMIRDIKEQFEKTRWGNFMSTCKIGKTFGTLKELKI